MSDLTREEIEAINERSKLDHNDIVGSEIRQVCGTALRALDENAQLREAVAKGSHSSNACLSLVFSGVSCNCWKARILAATDTNIGEEKS